MNNEASIINKEMNDENLLKLKADLLIWYTFFQKCNQIEGGFYTDVEKSKGSKAHLLDRNISFDIPSIKTKGREDITVRCVNEFHQIPQLANEYSEYVENYKKIKELEEIKSNCEKKLSGLKIIVVLALLSLLIPVLGIVIAILMFLYVSKEKKNLNNELECAISELSKSDFSS